MILIKLTNLFGSKPHRDTDPVYDFFVHTKAKDKKRVYVRALKKVQKDQELIMRNADKMTVC
jgi:hypothetical protein